MHYGQSLLNSVEIISLTASVPQRLIYSVENHCILQCKHVTFRITYNTYFTKSIKSYRAEF